MEYETLRDIEPQLEIFHPRASGKEETKVTLPRHPRILSNIDLQTPENMGKRVRRCMHRQGMCSMSDLVDHLRIPAQHLHNGGNDAALEMMCFLAMAYMTAAQWQVIDSQSPPPIAATWTHLGPFNIPEFHPQEIGGSERGGGEREREGKRAHPRYKQSNAADKRSTYNPDRHLPGRSTFEPKVTVAKAADRAVAPRDQVSAPPPSSDLQEWPAL